MVNLLSTNKCGPIGLELGTHAVQMMQFSADGQRLVEAVRWDIPRAANETTPQTRTQALVEAIGQARQGRKFRGRDVVACLRAKDLFVQNIRVPKGPPADLARTVQQEAASRLPFPAAEAELYFLNAGDVRQGDQLRREVILLACHRPVIDELLTVIDDAGLRAVAIDTEPAALLRAYAKQFRRDDDRLRRAMFIRVGSQNSTVVIAQGTDVYFVKYIDVSGEQLDDAVATHLKISHEEAAALRANNGDRRADQQDPEIAASVTEATRGVVDRLIGELALCTRYHSVTFRGHTLDRMVLGGSEATQTLADLLAQRLELKCQLGDPLRSFESPLPNRRAQWDVTTGLALRYVDMQETSVATELTALIDVDFLPAAYRQRSVNRRAYAWRVMAAAAIVAVFASTALWQHNHHKRVRAALAEVEAQYAQAALHSAQLTDVGARLQVQHKMAQLLTLMRHRWPRSQVLAAAVEQLPDSVTLVECHLGHEVLPSTAPSAIALPQPNAPPPDEPTRRTHDVERLLREHHERRYFLSLTGYASDAATLHSYLARLGTSPLFAQIDLQSLENVPVDQSAAGRSPAVHFSVRAILRAPHADVLNPAGSASPEQSTRFPLARRGN